MGSLFFPCRLRGVQQDTSYLNLPTHLSPPHSSPSVPHTSPPSSPSSTLIHSLIFPFPLPLPSHSRPVEVVETFIAEVLSSTDMIPTRCITIFSTLFRCLYETEGGMFTGSAIASLHPCSLSSRRLTRLWFTLT